jgi:hypothetical protein
MGREDQRLGKKGEFRIFGELLTRDLTVYYPLFDVEGIDCIVRNKNGKHIDIQIKTRKDTKLWDVSGLKPRANFFIVVYVTEPKDQFWVLPSEEFIKFSKTVTYNGKKISRLIINSSNEEGFLKYQGDYGFKNIINFGEFNGVPFKSKNSVLMKKHIDVPHYKMQDFYPIVLEILKVSNKPLKRKEIVAKVREQIYDKLEDADKEILKSGGQRWEKTLMWAISHLSMQKSIISKTKNQWELRK